jgi:hypothetical protein
MSTVLQNAVFVRSPIRVRGVSAPKASYAAQTRSRALQNARRRREHVLACLALVMLIVAWNATLRLDEHVSPPRMRMSHAVELAGESQTQTLP